MTLTLYHAIVRVAVIYNTHTTNINQLSREREREREIVNLLINFEK